ncbi:MAG: hypothetical protein Q9216_006227 [Gyalolechia sp. 2 TL-2023]
MNSVPENANLPFPPAPDARNVDFIFCDKGHLPYLDLPVITKLQAFLSQTDRPEYEPRKTINSFHVLFKHPVEAWLKAQGIHDAELKDGPIIPAANNYFLARLYIIFNSTFFEGKLPAPLSQTAEEARLLCRDTSSIDGILTSDPSGKSKPAGVNAQQGIKIELVERLPENHLGTMTNDKNFRPILIAVRKRAIDQRYICGAEALQIMGSLLHEMCHAYDQMTVCRCLSCLPVRPEGMRYKYSYTGHSASWLYLTRCVQDAANKTFGFLGTFDLNLAGGCDYEKQGRAGVEREAQIWLASHPESI